MNALVSYASDSDSDSDSNSNEGLTAIVVEQKTVPPNTASTPTPITISSATQSKHQTPEGTPGTRTPDLREETNAQQDNQEEQQQQQQDENDDEDDFVLAALKDLQSFAASVDDFTASAQDDDDTIASVAVPVENSPLATATAIVTVSGAQPSPDLDEFDSTDMEVDQTDTATTTTAPQSTTSIEFTTEQQIVFDSFLQEIKAIPLLPLPSTDQLPLPPRKSSHGPSSASTSKSTLVDDDDCWIQAQTPQTIYSRIHQLSTLPQTEKFNPKEVENRLIEFAIRLLDWEQGGLKHVYFLGEERAFRELESRRRKEEEEKKISRESSDDDEGDESESDAGRGGTVPRYGGVVGEMIEFMHTVEEIAPPDDHWSVVWSLKELSYGFYHPATGTQLEEYPSIELRNRLNPPSSSSGTIIPMTAS
ncbi:hypothetical protein BGZ47_005583 [Haplosporangium gracile]|nr:hypothetical protein BGZ47_005583 [Haplosporangium gracile]